MMMLKVDLMILAKKNIAYFEKVLESCEAIICPEATCSAMLKVDYERFFEHDEHWKERAKKVPLTGFGYSLANGAIDGAMNEGLLGAITGGVKATAGGIAAAVLFSSAGKLHGTLGSNGLGNHNDDVTNNNCQRQTSNRRSHNLGIGQLSYHGIPATDIGYGLGSRVNDTNID